MSTSVTLATIDPRPTAVITQTTSWEQFAAAVHAYIQEHGLEPAGPVWEIYGHWTPDPDQVETEIYHLLR
ncbi:MAG: hypothetical protein WCD11_01620 [Solirubrobacteraceae bacterium]